MCSLGVSLKTIIMKLTNNFSLREFASKDGSETPESVMDNIRMLAGNLQVLRDEIGKPIIINSGYRSEAHNKRVGGVANSQHRFGRAADIRVNGMSPKQVYDTILRLMGEGKMHNGGVGLYNTFTHYDVRSNQSRWDYRK